MKKSIFGTLFSIGKAKTNEANDALKDKFSPELARQHIRDAEEAIKSSKVTLGGLKVDLRTAERELGDVQGDIAKLTTQLKEVVAAQGRESEFVPEILEKIKVKKDTEAAVQSRVNTIKTQVSKTQSSIDGATRRISTMQERMSTMEARQKANEARKALASSAAMDESAMSTATESFERFERQLEIENDRLEVAEETAEDNANSDLDSRLAAAGIGANSSADDDLLDSLLGDTKEKTEA